MQVDVRTILIRRKEGNFHRLRQDSQLDWKTIHHLMNLINLGIEQNSRPYLVHHKRIPCSFEGYVGKERSATELEVGSFQIDLAIV